MFEACIVKETACQQPLHPLNEIIVDLHCLLTWNTLHQKKEIWDQHIQPPGLLGPMSPIQKYVLITGCSANGLGAALVDTFLQRNYHVFATLRNPSKAPSHFQNIGNITMLTLDVLSPTDMASAVDAVRNKTGGRLDVLVNNSGRFEVMPALDTSIEEGKNLFDLNFWAPLAMIQAFAPLLIEAKGCVVNVSSVAAVLPLYFQSKEIASL